MYYDRDDEDLPRDWIRMMKEAMRVAGTHFTAERMVQEYAECYYLPALAGDMANDDPPAV